MRDFLEGTSYFSIGFGMETCIEELEKYKKGKKTINHYIESTSIPLRKLYDINSGNRTISASQMFFGDDRIYDYQNIIFGKLPKKFGVLEFKKYFEVTQEKNKKLRQTISTLEKNNF